jgi:hypothetical protein
MHGDKLTPQCQNLMSCALIGSTYEASSYSQIKISTFSDHFILYHLADKLHRSVANKRNFSMTEILYNLVPLVFAVSVKLPNFTYHSG